MQTYTGLSTQSEPVKCEHSHSIDNTHKNAEHFSHKTTVENLSRHPRIDEVYWEVSCAHPLVCVCSVCVKSPPLSMPSSVNRLLLELIMQTGSCVMEHGVGKQLTDTGRAFFKRLSSFHVVTC